MILINQQIYQLSEQLITNFSDNNLYIPIKANFFIQKNKKSLMEKSTEIEQSRLQIAQQYGVVTEDGNGYSILPENIEVAKKEIEDLFGIAQDVDIKMIALSDLGDTKLTSAQMETLMFMIDEDE